MALAAHRLRALTITIALACAGCIKSTQESVELAPEGGVTATFVAVLDRDEVLRLQHAADAFAAEVSGQSPATTELTEQLLLGYADRRRKEIAGPPGTEILSVGYTQDVAAKTVTERVAVRFATWGAWLRSEVSRAQDSIAEVRLAKGTDGTWTFERSGYVGGFRLDPFSGDPPGPPRPRAQPPLSRSMQFPGEVLSADASATVKGNVVTWDLQPPTGWKPLEYQHRVVFRSGAGLEPFHVKVRDVEPAPAPAPRPRSRLETNTDPGEGPLDGAGWESRDEFRSMRHGQVSPVERAVEGTVSIEGCVTRRGDPVPGAWITFMVRGEARSYGNELTVLAGPTGKYRVPGLWPGRYGVAVRVGDDGVWLPDLEVVAPSFVFDIALGAQDLEVLVADEAGRPLEGVEIFAHEGNRQAVLFGSLPTTDAQGRARVPFLTPGTTYRISASLDAGHVDLKDVEIVAGTEPARVTLRVSGFATVVVQVVDADGLKSPAYIRLTGDGPRQPDIGRFTDASGRSVFYVRPDTWLLGLDSVPARRNEEARYRQFAKRLTAVSGAVIPVVLVKPKR